MKSIFSRLLLFPLNFPISCARSSIVAFGPFFLILLNERNRIFVALLSTENFRCSDLIANKDQMRKAIRSYESLSNFYLSYLPSKLVYCLFSLCFNSCLNCVLTIVYRFFVWYISHCCISPVLVQYCSVL